MKQLPSISIIARTLNTNLSMFRRVLEAVKMQKYPKKLVEYIVADGGSTNGTIELAKEYGCKVIQKDFSVDEEARAGLAIKAARGDLILDLESDNIITSDVWFLQMVKPFQENKNIFFTYSAYNGYEKDMTLTSRYCALIGAPDPVLYYLNKSEKIPLYQQVYTKGDMLDETKDYYVIEFNKENLPTLGANGCMILRSALNKVNKNALKFTHTDAIAQLVDMGYTTFGVVKNSLIHAAAPRVLDLVRRRVEVKQKYSDARRGRRKYLVYNSKSAADRFNLMKCILFSMTFVIPFSESIVGYFRSRDVAWFLHAPISFLLVVGYGISELQFQFSRIVQRVRKAL